MSAACPKFGAGLLPHRFRKHPDYIGGVINGGGVVIPAVDLRNPLGLGHTQACARHVIVRIPVGGVQETFQVSEGYSASTNDQFRGSRLFCRSDPSHGKPTTLTA